MWIKRILAAVGVVAFLFCLTAFGTMKQDVADPITMSPIPQPDWLFLIFFQVTRYCQAGMEMLGVFWAPALLLLGMTLLPFLDRGKKRKAWLKWSLVIFCLALFAGFSFVSHHTGSTTPVNSCAACHKEGFGDAFGAPPALLSDFSKRYDNKWLALHYRYPQYFWMMDANVPKW